GRRKGTPNKATADIRALAQVHAEKAMTELARLATSAESEAARVAAIKELFDRGFGKAKQSLDHSSSDGSMVPKPSRIIIEAATDDDSKDQAAAEAGEALQQA
ncbi:hypothetical protein, partial [uncultured Brevundimonas sp.]|uniref:hypothetical protein n=1 Tax=uncultured Brevundimonas sp. TaxID=213418 RepID=UPI0026058B24